MYYTIFQLFRDYFKFCLLSGQLGGEGNSDIDIEQFEEEAYIRIIDLSANFLPQSFVMNVIQIAVHMFGKLFQRFFFVLGQLSNWVMWRSNACSMLPSLTTFGEAFFSLPLKSYYISFFLGWSFWPNSHWCPKWTIMVWLWQVSSLK